MTRHAGRFGNWLAWVLALSLLAGFAGYAIVHLSPAAEAAQGDSSQDAVSHDLISPASVAGHGLHVASSGASCESCHQGEATVLYASVHRTVGCTDCHRQLPDGSMAMGDNTCTTCHQGIYSSFQDSVHSTAAQAKLSCVSCHGSHSIQTPDRTAQTTACESCHQKEYRTYIHDNHAPSGSGKPAATCTDCHDPHTARSAPEGALAPSDLQYTLTQCTTCHATVAGTVAASVHSTLPGLCTDCHTGYHDQANAGRFQQVAAASCESCHQEESASYLAGAHAQAAGSGITCTDCHGTHAVANPTAIKADLSKTCESCHADVAHNLKTSAHGQGNLSCLDCHSIHATTAPATTGSTAASNGNALCLSCHQDVASDFQTSKHGEAGVACTACHDPHTTPTATGGNGQDLLQAAGSACGDCHQDEGNSVSASVHADVGCVGCHIAGGATSSAGAGGAAAAAGGGVHQKLTNLAGLAQPAACLDCHTDIGQSWDVNIHGTAYNLGSARAPTCVTCHGVHDILPPDNPASRVGSANVAKTCGTCHTGATVAMASGPEHFVVQDRRIGVVFWVWVFFVGLIIFDIIKDGPIVIMELWRRFRGP